MKTFKIEYVETVHGYFGVEADTKEEALRRFDEWRLNDDHVYDVMSNSDNIDSNAFIFDRAEIYDDDILTDEMYQRL